MKHAREDYQRIQDPAGIIPEDEPVFLLRASDMNAPAAVRYWAHLAHLNKASRTMHRSAMDHAKAMEAWQIEHGRKIPDMPEPSPAAPPIEPTSEAPGKTQINQQ